MYWGYAKTAIFGVTLLLDDQIINKNKSLHQTSYQRGAIISYFSQLHIRNECSNINIRIVSECSKSHLTS